jgi:hypothetical protein
VTLAFPPVKTGVGSESDTRSDAQLDAQLEAEARPEALVISCDECAMQHTNACDDCLVSFILDREPGGVVIDAEEARAVRMLTSVGLVPGPRHVRKAG